MSQIINEAFQELKGLNEDTFSFNKEGFDRLQSFLTRDLTDETVEIIDPEAENSGELKPNYLNDCVLECCVCHDLIYKNPKDIVVDEETQKVNVDEECPHCYNMGGFKVIGQIKPLVDEASLTVTVDGDDVEVKEVEKTEEKRDASENLTEGTIRRQHLDVWSLIYEQLTDPGYLVPVEGKQRQIVAGLYPYQRVSSDGENIVVEALTEEELQPAKDVVDKFKDRGASYVVKKEKYSRYPYKLVITAPYSDDMVESLREDVRSDSLKRELTSFLDDREYDTSDPEVKEYIDSAAEYIQMSRDAGNTYSVEEWYKDTKENYPEDLKELKKKKSTHSNVEDEVLKIFDENDFDVEDEEVKKYAEAAAEYIVETRNNWPQYSVEEWFEDTKMNYPEDLDELKKVNESLNESISKNDRDIIIDAVKCEFETGHGYMEDKDEFEETIGRRLTAAKYEELKEFYSELQDLGPAGFYEEYKDKLEFDPDFVEEFGYEEDDRDDEDDKDFDESLNESFEKATIETADSKLSMESDDNGKVTVVSEPKKVDEETYEGPETIAPVAEETEDVIEANATESEGEEEPEEKEESMEEVETEETMPEDSEDIDIDEFDENEFNSLGESYLKEVYNNVDSFKTVRGYVNGDSLKLEGVITFKSGKKLNTSFLFESNLITKTGKVKLLGENLQFAQRKNSFTLTCSVKDKKLVMEALTYNYNAKDASTGKSKRIYGTVKNK